MLRAVCRVNHSARASVARVAWATGAKKGEPPKRPAPLHSSRGEPVGQLATLAQPYVLRADGAEVARASPAPFHVLVGAGDPAAVAFNVRHRRASS